MKRILFFTLLIVSPVFIFAQSNKTFWYELELGYGWSIKDNGGSVNFSNDNLYGKMILFQAKVKAAYYLTPVFSLGAAVGLNGYHNPNYNTLPIFIDLRYHFVKSLPKLFAFADIGGSFSSNGDYTKGFISEIGAAYKIPLGKRISLNPSLGYNLFIYSNDWGGGKESRNRHTISLKLGFEF